MWGFGIRSQPHLYARGVAEESPDVRPDVARVEQLFRVLDENVRALHSGAFLETLQILVHQIGQSFRGASSRRIHGYPRVGNRIQGGRHEYGDGRRLTPSTRGRYERVLIVLVGVHARLEENALLEAREVFFSVYPRKDALDEFLVKHALRGGSFETTRVQGGVQSREDDVSLESLALRRFEEDVETRRDPRRGTPFRGRQPVANLANQRKVIDQKKSHLDGRDAPL